MGQAAARVNESSRARGALPSRWPAGRYAFSSWDYRELSENQAERDELDAAALSGTCPPFCCLPVRTWQPRALCSH